MHSIRLFFAALSDVVPQSAVLIGVAGWLVFILLFILPTIVIVTAIGGV